ncbi:MAG TPA: winged helix-turn-helix domain-containing protein [Solirubrobacterales bacterium]|nr:winged helix-turn-helix domain-containing protein [Solirubrobacterales bacterium]
MAADPVKRDILRVVLERPVEAGPNSHYKITAGGREGLFVGFVIERWLHSAPEGPLDFAGEQAELAVKALADGWSAGVVHALARGPRTVRELQGATDGLGKRGLRRGLAAMRRAGLVEVRASADPGAAVYVATDWLRAGVAALIAAARVERRHPSAETVPIDALDVEAAFLLALPLLELPEDVSGSCRLGVSLDDGVPLPTAEPGPAMAGVTARIERGRVVSCTPGLDLRAETWGAATASDWLDTVIEPDVKRVRTGGDRRLAAILVNALHQTLFGVPTRG